MDIALKQYGIQVQRSKTMLELIGDNMYNIIIHMILEERDNGE